jgi:hypothetical protein
MKDSHSEILSLVVASIPRTFVGGSQGADGGDRALQYPNDIKGLVQLAERALA